MYKDQREIEIIHFIIAPIYDIVLYQPDFMLKTKSDTGSKISKKRNFIGFCINTIIILLFTIDFKCCKMLYQLMLCSYLEKILAPPCAYYALYISANINHSNDLSLNELINLSSNIPSDHSNVNHSLLLCTRSFIFRCKESFCIVVQIE
uniref:Uncharacterized protein n=1 Tax=Onchocerca volvulus TaxID=6282 RepID=A0A8R1Y084_ONCVO